jgi:hypothetical protein
MSLRAQANVFIEFNGSVPPLPYRGAEIIAWKLKPDTRTLSQGGDREARCRRCHARIVLSPDDKRMGFCFDCYDSMEIRRSATF